MTLLLVDDDALIARGALRLIASLGHVGRHASTLAEARDLLTSREVDIVIADLALEGQESGVDLLHWLRENRPDVRRVLTSGSSRPQVTIDSPEQAFLSKPFGRTELAAILGTA